MHGNFHSCLLQVAPSMKNLKLVLAIVQVLLNVVALTDAFVGGGRSNGFATRSSVSSAPAVSSSALYSTWNNGNSYGKGPFTFYKGFDEWMKPFPEEDRELYPDMFRIPAGTFEVRMARPLGIVFEELEAGGGGGVYVKELVEGGNAEAKGVIKPGDRLIAVTAVKVVGAKWERRLLPCTTWDFDTVVGAIGSNDIKWGCNDVILLFERPGEADEDEVKKHLAFFEPPFDSMWKRA